MTLGRLLVVGIMIATVTGSPFAQSPPASWDESFRALDFMVKTRLFTSQIVLQIIVGTLVPLALLATTQLARLAERTRVRLYMIAGVLTLVGIFAMRWNVVIGGQLFSKSFLGYTTYKMGFATREGLLPAILVMLLPLGILTVLVKLLPPWQDAAPRDEDAVVPVGTR